jgi:uncharacterized protein YndB with AHSA1/START domain
MTTPALSPLHIRRSIHIAAPPERVWREFETFERMAAWFGTGHRLVRYEPRAGGIVELEIDSEYRGSSRWGGPITVFDPARELTFEDRWIPDLGWDGPMLVTFRLTPYRNGTLVELFIHDIEATGAGAEDTHAGGEGGWTVRHLAKLREIIEGSPA